jgi:hypothetical protein
MPFKGRVSANTSVNEATTGMLLSNLKDRISVKSIPSSSAFEMPDLHLIEQSPSNKLTNISPFKAKSYLLEDLKPN